MTVTLQTQWDEVSTTDSATESEQGAELRFFAKTTGGENEVAVRAAVKPAVPDFYDGLLFSKLTIKRHQETDDHWECIAFYESPASAFTQPALEVDDVRWSVRSGGNATLKRAYSRKLISEVVTNNGFRLAGTEAEKIVGLKLGENGGLEAVGHSYSVGVVEISAETVKDAATVSQGYLVDAATYANQHATNSVAWRGFAAGTCKLESYSASERSGSGADWDVAFSVSFSPNLTNIKVGNLNVSSKKGHQLLDVLFQKKKVGKISMGVPVRAAVHEWFPEVNFNQVLGI